MTAQGREERATQLRRAIDLKRAMRSRRAALPSRPRDHEPHLGEMQRSLWLLHRLDPSSAAYNLTRAFWLSSVPDISALERGLNVVVARHRLLRSTFRADRQRVLQVVHPQTHLALEVIVVADGTAQSAAVREARTPFDLEARPPIRMVLIEERTTQERLLLLTLHHILADERSLTLLWEELALAYDGRLSEEGPQCQFDDYEYWSAGRTPDARARELDYWRQRFDPEPDDLVLPFENPVTLPSRPTGRLLSKVPDRGIQPTIYRLASSIGATPFLLFAFAFRLLLERYVPGQRIAFATPVSTRSHAAAAEMIGYFLNPVVIQTSLDENESVERGIRAFAREVRDLLSHASIPFDVLTEHLVPTRRRGRHPFFQVMLVYQETSPPSVLGNVHLTPVALDLGESKFDLTLFVIDHDESLELGVEYRTDRFDEVWIRSLLDHYETLLQHLADDVDRPIAQVPILTAAEERRLLVDWQGAPSKATPTGLLPEQILARARRLPDAPAVVCGETRQSYGELERSAAAVAKTLVALGVRAGDRVGLFLDRSVLVMAGVLGVHWAGAAYVPLDPDYPSARTCRTLRDAEVVAVLTSVVERDHLPEGAWKTICVDELEHTGSHDVVLPDLTPASSAYLLYTSGSTGHPKGVVVTHDNLRASTIARREVYDAPPERFLLLPSVAFDSSVAGIFWTLSSGGTLVIPTDEEARDARRLAQLVAKARVTMLLCVPSLYAQMLRFGGDHLQQLTTAIVAGERCSSQLVQDHFAVAPHVRLFNEYGPTEATVWATVHEVTELDAHRPVSIGRPIPGVRVHVWDTLGRRVPPGIPGQGWIAGATVAQGYWQRPDLTDERFSVDTTVSEAPERLYRSGDRVSWTPDGRLLFLGREDDQIKLRGFRIEPGEVEAVLLEQPFVEEAAVVARSLGPGPVAGAGSSDDTQLVAFVRTTGEGRGGWPRESLAERLPDFMVPRRHVELAELPHLPNGKVDRERLRAMPLAAEVTLDAHEETAPAHTREQALVSLWEGLLGRGPVRVTDNFFELGGHSLLVVAMIDSIERDHGVTLAAADVFQHPTVRELAERINDSRRPDSVSYAHLFPIQPGGRDTPFIVAVPHFFSSMFATRFRGERPVYGLRGVSLRAEGNVGRWRTMTDLGEELVEEILLRFPGETYVVAGYSFGASMAAEAVRLMEERGIPVQRLYLIAPMPLDFQTVGPFRLQIGALRRPLDELSWGDIASLLWRDNNLFTRRPYRRAWLTFAVRPWRRLLCLMERLRRLVGLPLTPRILYADVRAERLRLHRRYRPRPIQAPTVIFNATEPETDAAATWRPWFGGSLTVVEIPDPHGNEASVERARDLILRQLDTDV